MELKNKAGLALALAAIFTTGGANVAFAADNVTDNTVAPGEIINGVQTGQVNVDAAEDTAGLDASNLNPGTNAQIAIDNDTSIVVEVSGDTVNDVPLIINGGTVEMTGKSSSLDLTLGSSKNGTNTTAAVTGDYVLNTLVTNANTLVEVGIKADGTPGDAGTLEIANADLNGGTIFADPAFVTDEYGPSQVAINAFGEIDKDEDFINGKLIAGRNSTITIGSNSHKLVDEAIAEIGLAKWGAGADQYSAAMAFIGRQTLDTSLGGLLVDGTVTSETLPLPTVAGGNIIFGNNSLAVFDLTGVGAASDTGALAGEGASLGTVTIGGNGTAGVYFTNAVAGNSYMIIEDATTINIGTGDWGYTDGSKNIYFANGMLNGTWQNKGELDGGNGDDLVLDVEYNGTQANDTFVQMSDGMSDVVTSLFAAGLNIETWWDGVAVDPGKTTDNAAVWFISNAINTGYGIDEATAMVEGAAQIAVAGGVPYLANNIVTRVNNLIVDHNDMLNATQPAYGNEPGQLGIWATPFYGLSDVDGMDAGHLENGFELNYGGAAFGLDYNVNEAFRLGAALNVGGGSTDADNGSGDFYNTENDFDFFGASLYGSYTNGAFGLTGDLGFSGIDSEITQRTPLGSLKSDVDSNVFTLGLTGKYRFVAGENLNVAPHLGLRYTQVSMDDAKVTLADKGTLFNTSVDDMSLFQIPLGIEFSSNMVTDGGWTVTPHADLGVLFTMGDTDVDTRFTAPNFPTATDTGFINAEVIDEAAFTGTLGIKAQADNGLSLGLDYGILASGNQTDHQFTGMLRFEF